jgi:16S rRNA (guanine(966)-N(2))-methyltransferase RsmD
MKSKKELYTTILAGKYKGKKITLPSKLTTRSTKSIVKESFFNSIQFEIEGKLFVEVFGGSGLMGLEALSRGAKEAFFIEKDRGAYERLLKNCNSLAPNETHVILGDSFSELLKITKSIDERAIFYFDPPFDIRDGMEGIYEKVMELIASIDIDKIYLLAIEHMSGLKIDERIGKLTKVKSKKFGKTTLTFYNLA